MHKEWEELIPYYVAGSLPRADTARLESHLAKCPECRRSVEEWRSVATAVRAEAAAQLRDLPPLSAYVTQRAAQQAGERRAPFEGQPFPRPAVRSASSRAAAVTLIAAVFTVIVFGGLLMFMLRGVLPQPAAGGVALLPTDTPFPATVTEDMAATQFAALAAATETPSPAPQIIIIEPSATPVSPSPVPPTQAPLIFNTPVQTRPLPTRVPLTSAPPPTAAPLLPTNASPLTFSIQSASAKAGCTLYAASANPVSLYAGPGAQYAVAGTITQADELTALAVTDSGWFQAQYAEGTNLATGWVRAEQVFTRGNCDGLPIVAAQATGVPLTSLPPTPTADASVPVVVITDSVNLRSGPSTDYPVVDMALSGERLPVSARASTARGDWYLVQRGTLVWVSASVVRLFPADAVIAPAATIPPLPDPTATILPFMPTLTPSPVGSPADSSPKPAP